MSNLSKIHLSKYQIEDKKYGLTTDTNREIDLTGEIGTGEKGRGTRSYYFIQSPYVR